MLHSLEPQLRRASQHLRQIGMAPLSSEDIYQQLKRATPMPSINGSTPPEPPNPMEALLKQIGTMPQTSNVGGLV